MAACDCPADDYYIDQTVGQATEIANNSMQLVFLDDDHKLSLILVKQNDEFRAVGSHCPHYGASLWQGALGAGRIRCPWHGACFRTRTGDIEEFPGTDSLPSYPVRVEHGLVKVRALHSQLVANRRLSQMARRDPDDPRCYVLLGGGPASATCAESLRQHDFSGRIVIVCQEPQLPYDRVKVTKAMDTPVGELALRTEAFYAEHGIELLRGVAATSVDGAGKCVHLDNGDVLRWDKLFVGTGSRAAPVPKAVKGGNAANVRTIRSHEDAAFVHSQLGADRHVVCIGLSFIALESAAFCVKRAAKVTVVGRDSVPLRRSFGPQIGLRLQQWLEQNGVEFVLNAGQLAECLLGEKGQLVAVKFTDNTEIKCDLCIVGTGIVANTELLRDSGVHLNDDGTVNVDVHMQTNVSDIYAGGDIAMAPVLGGQPAAIGHYALAQYHGRIAGRNMSGLKTTAKPVPYFWTSMLGKSVRFGGWTSEQPRSTQVLGSLSDMRFVVIYYDCEDKVQAMASCNYDPVVSQWAEWMAQDRRRLTREELSKDPLGWTKELGAEHV